MTSEIPEVTLTLTPPTVFVTVIGLDETGVYAFVFLQLSSVGICVRSLLFS